MIFSNGVGLRANPIIGLAVFTLVIEGQIAANMYLNSLDSLIE